MTLIIELESLKALVLSSKLKYPLMTVGSFTLIEYNELSSSAFHPRPSDIGASGTVACGSNILNLLPRSCQPRGRWFKSGSLLEFPNFDWQCRLYPTNC